MPSFLASWSCSFSSMRERRTWGARRFSFSGVSGMLDATTTSLIRAVTSAAVTMSLLTTAAMRFSCASAALAPARMRMKAANLIIGEYYKAKRLHRARGNGAGTIHRTRMAGHVPLSDRTRSPTSPRFLKITVRSTDTPGWTSPTRMPDCTIDVTTARQSSR